MKIIHKNKKALFDYELLDKFVAGIQLTGAEVKSIRDGGVDLKGAYVTIRDGEAFLRNSNIARYKHDSREGYEPFRERKLLLKKSEIEKLESELNTQGVSVIPIAVGLQGRHIKLEIALARGKKKHDKRQSIKDRDVKRRLQRLTAR